MKLCYQFVNNWMKQEKLILSPCKKETERIQNRKLMERIIDLIICLAKCGKSFCGHNESLKVTKRRLF